MLIDTGADISVLPMQAVETLELAEEGPVYQVVAFDNVSRECKAVHAELLFMRKRFKGQFLVLDQEVGVLGRDVLNHVVLKLNGPSREWESN
jgi:hypothetical protein